jgi:hypothetical protein
MKYSFSIFFLVVMTLNVTLPLVERLWGKDMYELAVVGTDDTDEENKKEKETEKLKEVFSFFSHASIKLDAFYLELFRKSLFAKNEFPKSELYAFLPEQPPQA